MRNNYNYYPNNYNRMDYDEFINNLNFSQNMMQNNQTQQSNNTLYGPYEGYIKGNLFKNLYEEKTINLRNYCQNQRKKKHFLI